MSISSQNQMPLGRKVAAGEEGLPTEGEGDAPRTMIRRAVSDSQALSKALFEDSIPGLAVATDYDETSSVGLTGLESAFVYGPNSPRKKGASISDYSLVSALSESVSKYHQPSVREPARASTGKRSSWQQSRDRKVQYIAELERTINILQTLNTELEVRVVSQNQQCVALSMENNKLMQRVATLEDQMFIKEGQFQLLKKENERLKIAFAGAPPEAAESLVTLQMLDLAKLNLS